MKPSAAAIAVQALTLTALCEEEKEVERKKEIRRAVALTYNSANDSAPRVCASGAGVVAEKIVQLAQNSGVPVRENTFLSEALGLVPIGMEIPESLYVAVAQILAEIMQLDQEENKL